MQDISLQVAYRNVAGKRKSAGGKSFFTFQSSAAKKVAQPSKTTPHVKSGIVA
jgi:hypothetical protein